MNTISANVVKSLMVPATAVLMAGVVLSGCAGLFGSGMSPDRIARAPTESDIVDIVAIYDPMPWLFASDEDMGGPLGIRIRSLFLVSAKTKKGVFGDGTLRMTLYSVHRGSDSRLVRGKIHEWQFDKDQAVASRVAKKTWMGYGYMFDLAWPEEMNLAGQEIALGIEYVRADGKVVRERPKYFRVTVGS